MAQEKFDPREVDLRTLRTIRADKLASSTIHMKLGLELEVVDPVEPRSGDVVVVQTLSDNPTYNNLELVSGRLARIKVHDIIVGVLGRRRALRGFVGDVPTKLERDDNLHILNLGGLLGRCTGRFHGLGRPIQAKVLGMVVRDGRVLNISEHGLQEVDRLHHHVPLVLITGTSMNVGKTQVAAEVIKQFSRNGYRIAGAKLSGVAALRDTLDMQDHGAFKTASFLDCGHPSTVGLRDLGPVARTIVHHLSEEQPDVIVIEMGDGLLGGYSVDSLFDHEDIRRHFAAVILCAPDFVGVYGGVGWLKEKNVQTDIVSGPVTDSQMGIQLIKKRFGLDAANAINDGEILFKLVESRVKAWWPPPPVA